MSNPVIFSYALDGANKGEGLTGDETSTDQSEHSLAWTHLDAKHTETPAWLARNLSCLDRHAIDALMAEETRPRATEIGDGLLVMLRGINLNEGAEPEDMVSVRVWIDAHRIVSIQRQKLRAVLDIEERIKRKAGPETSGQFIALLADRLTTRIEPLVAETDDAADALEEQISDDPAPELRNTATSIRRRTIQLRRYIAPQRDAIATLRNAEVDWLDDMNRRRLTEVQDRLTRIVEDLDAIRERSQIVKEELTSLTADLMKRNTYILSVIAAIFLPLGFLTGLLGVNIAGIPGSDTPWAFAAFCGAMLILVIVQIILFRWLRWF